MEKKKADEIEASTLARLKPLLDLGCSIDTKTAGVGIIGGIPSRSDASPQRYYARPADRSFEAYSEFILGMTAALGGENDVTEEELREAWREFWQKADAAASREESQ